MLTFEESAYKVIAVIHYKVSKRERLVTIAISFLLQVFLKVADDTNVDVDEDLEKGLESFSEGKIFH